MSKLLIISLCILLTSCSIFKPYHMDIQQGNALSSEQAAKIHPGMSKKTVIETLGEPIQTDTLDKNRIDYIYTNQKSGGVIEEKRLTIFFKNNKVTKIINQQHDDIKE